MNSCFDLIHHTQRLHGTYVRYFALGGHEQKRIFDILLQAFCTPYLKISGAGSASEERYFGM